MELFGGRRICAEELVVHAQPSKLLIGAPHIIRSSDQRHFLNITAICELIFVTGVFQKTVYRDMNNVTHFLFFQY